VQTFGQPIAMHYEFSKLNPEAHSPQIEIEFYMQDRQFSTVQELKKLGKHILSEKRNPGTQEVH